MRFKPGMGISFLKRAVALICVVWISMMWACTGGPQPGPETGPTRLVRGKVQVEANLFDTKIHYNGKLSSVRLEIFVTDSIVGVGGRTYLGKGAVKGWLDSDTVKLYFPVSDEYVYEPISDLFQSFGADGEIPTVDILRLFTSTPDQLPPDTLLTITQTDSDSDRPAYQLSTANQPWRMELVYDQREPGLRLREFFLSEGEDLEISARRREFRAESSIKATKFTVAIPHSAVQIIP